MKKIALFSLLAIFLFNSFGYYIVFKVSQSQARKEIKSRIKLGLPSQELASIVFSKKDIKNIHWLKKDKEFFYNNKLYDIVKTDESSTSITFHCISDEQEQFLFAKLDEHVQVYISNDNRKDSGSKKLKEHVIKIYFMHTDEHIAYKNSSPFEFSIQTKNYQSEFSETKSPPPEFV